VTIVQNYLQDALPELVARARDAKAKAVAQAQAADAADVAFERGRALAYYEVVSHLIGQLDAFGIERGDVGLDPSYDVDRDLL
jgi:hypothetical protein